MVSLAVSSFLEVLDDGELRLVLILVLTAEKYNLNWHSFSEHLQWMFKYLYQEGRYTDVTLVSDDQTQFTAHKIVLSFCGGCKNFGGRI